jgi:hypothetical protein
VNYPSFKVKGEFFMSKKTIFFKSIPFLLFVVFSRVSLVSAAEPPRHPEISKMLVGNNVWYNPGDDKWKIAAQCPLQSVRIGGIGYNDNFPSNEIEGWIAKIKAMGAEPIIQMPASWNGGQAADWVKKHMDINYYNISNEPKLKGVLGGSTGAIAGMIKNQAPAMKAANPKIKIFVPDECDLWYADSYYKDLFSVSGGGNDVSGKTPDGKYWMVDGISWHRYADGDITNDVGQRIKGAWELADAVNKAKGRTGEDRLRCGIGEFNHNGGGGVATFINGQAFACIFGLCAKYDYTYATMWSIYESGGNLGGTDFSMIGNNGPRATFYNMQMISQNFSGIYCDGTSSQTSVVTYGSRDTNKLCAMIINKGGSSQSYTIRFNTDPISSGSCKINIDADTGLEYKDEIPGNATQCIVISCSGSKKIQFTAGNYSANAPSTSSAITAKFCGAVGIRHNKERTDVNPRISITRAHNGIAIHLPASQQYRAKILSLNGEVLREDAGMGKDAFLRINGLATGVYVVNLVGDNVDFKTKCLIGSARR